MITVVALCLLACVVLGAAGILINTPERPRVRAAGAHTRRAVRRAGRAEDEDDKTVAWLAGLKRPAARVPALAIARARVTGLAAVLGMARDGEPRCRQCGTRLDAGCPHTQPEVSRWMTVPGPWDTERPTETIEVRLDGQLVPEPPLPELPVDLGHLATRYASLFRSSWSPAPARPDVILTAVGPSPMLPTPNARAGNWHPRHADPEFPDWDPSRDDTGLRHLAYPWADQLAADFDPAPARG